MDIPDPQKYELATVVSKNSKTGISSNKRLLVIKKGFLYYYSSVPKIFKGDPKVLQTLQQLPKCSIEIANIKQIKGYQNNSSYFSIQFDAKHMMERQDIRKTKMLEEFNFAPKNTKEVITWQFTCDNQFIKQRWVSSLQTLHSHYSKEKQSIQKYFQNIHKKQDQVSMRSSTKVPWIQDQSKKNSPNSSQRNSKVIQNRRSQSPGRQNSSSPVKQSPINSSPPPNEDIVQNFMMLEKIKDEEKVNKEMPIVEELNQSSQLTPMKMADQSNELKKQIEIDNIPEKQQQKVITRKESIKEVISSQKIGIDQFSLNELHPVIEKKSIKKSYNFDDEANFYEAQYYSCLRQSSFNQRIKAQKRLNELIGTFIQNSSNTFIEFVNEKKNSTQKYEQVKLQDGLSLLEIGFIKFKIGYVGTQALTINKKPKIYYNQEVVKKLKRQMKAYNAIWQKIVQSNKNYLKTTQIQKIQQLKVPLCTYIQYKGVCCLAFENKNASIQEKITGKQELFQWKDLISKMGFNSQNFIFKKLQNSDNVVCYLNSVKGIYKNTIEKHHNIEFQPFFNVEFLKKIKKQGASTSSESLLKYIRGIKTINSASIHGCSKNQIFVTLSYCYFCKYLRKIYRAAQGQIDELHFINLILKGDEHISQLFESAGFIFETEDYSKEIHGVLFDFIRYYLGIVCEVNHRKLEEYGRIIPLGIRKNSKHLNSVNIINSVILKVRTLSYNMCSLDLYQSFANLQKYIINKDLSIVHKSIQIKEQTYSDNHYQQSIYPWSTSLQLLQNTAELHFVENDYISCIKKCKEFLILCSPNDQLTGWEIPAPSSTFPIYLLMLKAYSKFSSENFNATLKEVSENIIYNYGESSTLLISLFSFAGLSFATMNSFLQAQSFLEMAIKLNEKTGSDPIKFSQLYLDLARINFRSGKIEKGKNYFQEAEMLIERQGQYKEKLNLYMYELQIQLSDEKSSSSFEKCESTITKISKMIKEDLTENQILKELQKLIFEIGYKYEKLQLCEDAIEDTWKLNSMSSKIFAIELCVKLARKENIKIEINKFEETRQLSKEQALLILDEKKYLFNSFWEMFNEATMEEDKHIFEAFNSVFPLNQLSY